MAPDVIPVHTVDTLATLSKADLVVAGFLARYKGKTRESYTFDLLAFYRWCAQIGLDPLDATRFHFELWLRWMEEEKGYAQSTVARRFGTVALMFRYALFDGHIDKDPTLHVTRPRVDHEGQKRTVLHPLEFAALITVARASKNPVDHAVIALLGMLGLRVGEMCACDVTDLRVDYGYDVLHIIGKGNRAAVVPLPIPVLRPIREVVGDRTSGPLLLNRDGQRLMPRAADRILQRLAKQAGILHPITPHGLRRTFATTGLSTGVPLRDVQVAMRHVDPRTTSRYDMGQANLDRHASHPVAAFLSGMAS